MKKPRYTLKDGLSRQPDTSQRAEDERLELAVTIALAILVSLLVFSLIVILFVSSQ